MYVDSDEPITEEIPRLLDVCEDTDYLKTNEYALAKVREEDVLENRIGTRPPIYMLKSSEEIQNLTK